MMLASPIRSTVPIALLAVPLFACTPPDQPEQAEQMEQAKPMEQADADAGIFLETEDDKTIYAMGVNLARNFDHLPLSESERTILQAGFADGVQKREPQVDTARYGRRVEALFARRNADAAAGESAAAEAFLDEAAAEEGAVRSESGLIMKVLKPGDGPSPGPTDRVRVHYHGTLRDGTVFDSSVVRGEPAVFPLDRVVPCWTEALQKMKVGEKSRVVCPASIAYGDRGAPPLIKPGAALDFEVELLEILR